MSKTYHLFISHSWAYSDAYEKLINLLNKDANFSYTNYWLIEILTATLKL